MKTPNDISISACGSYVTLHLPGGEAAVIDVQDYPKIQSFRWTANRRKHTTYAQTHVRKEGRRTTVMLHRLLLDAPAGSYVDHADGDGLNNARANLRACTNTENQQNGRKQRRPTTSKWKGVSRFRRQWKAEIRVGGEYTYLGLFDEESDAAQAYNFAAAAHFGPFARYNQA